MNTEVLVNRLNNLFNNVTILADGDEVCEKTKGKENKAELSALVNGMKHSIVNQIAFIADDCESVLDESTPVCAVCVTVPGTEQRVSISLRTQLLHILSDIDTMGDDALQYAKSRVVSKLNSRRPDMVKKITNIEPQLDLTFVTMVNNKHKEMILAHNLAHGGK